jgi:hypothetical protein
MEFALNAARFPPGGNAFPFGADPNRTQPDAGRAGWPLAVPTQHPTALHAEVAEGAASISSLSRRCAPDQAAFCCKAGA